MMYVCMCAGHASQWVTWLPGAYSTCNLILHRWTQCHIPVHICRPSSGQRSPARQLLAASVPYCIARWARDFCHLPRTCMSRSPRSQTDRLSCAANSLWHLRRWLLWGHRMRSCQYRRTRLARVHASATAWKWTGNKWAATNALMDEASLHSCTVYQCSQQSKLVQTFIDNQIRTNLAATRAICPVFRIAEFWASSISRAPKVPISQ